ncbi:MAG: signal peptidase I [Actinomycetota bacterium]|nr:signal peptidase I [Actinomycetota bacterium]
MSDNTLPDQPVTPAKKRRFRSNVYVAIASLLIATLLRLFIVQSFYIPSGSMIPTLQINDRILVSKINFGLFGVKRGDIVVFRRPPADKVDPTIQDLVKRVIGLPGDTISAKNGVVYIDGHPLAETYLPKNDPTYNLTPIKVPAGDYFMMGDNRTDSYDSRFFGPVPGSLFVGQVVMRYYPLSRIGFF